jgi:hypothetical protein
LENTIKYAQEQKSEAQPCANYSGECIWKGTANG